ncbi:hypothetical protein E5676_scaffold403G001580 [Cucumis melo var. makuwa]|uniref:Uncharacterized protein n=1 Tax=Cucumis melo var. makuwa TaxID=1194695 RepID=A0A5D3DYH4_CUCMM|nr:hypothetical protein E5676_scaffold403G001580 [Cucumis melo var. makuwa]
MHLLSSKSKGVDKKIKFSKSVGIPPKAHQEDNSDVAFFQPGLILSPSHKLKALPALPALESASSLSSSNQSLSMANSDSKSSKVSLNNVIKQAARAREANKLEPSQKLPIGTHIPQNLKEESVASVCSEELERYEDDEIKNSEEFPEDTNKAFGLLLL